MKMMSNKMSGCLTFVSDNVRMSDKCVCELEIPSLIIADGNSHLF